MTVDDVHHCLSVYVGGLKVVLMQVVEHHKEVVVLVG